MLGIGWSNGPEGHETLRRVVAATHAGTLVAFARNAGDPRESFEAIASAREIAERATGIRALVAADQEGGTVARFVEGFTSFPGALAQAAAVASGVHAVADIRKAGRACGQELRAIGIDWNLAPDADVNSNPDNPVIGVRSYGDDPEGVARRAAELARGLAQAGLLACAKHFPGHGDTAVDSHAAAPRVERDRAALEAVELVPFRRLVEDGVGSVMLSHVLYPALEPEPLPASLSPAIATGLLRREMGFRGLITTDCLEMRAITDNYPDAAVRAVLAGCDILFVSHTADAQISAHAAILRAIRAGRIPEARILESVARILAAKAALPRPPAAFDDVGFTRGSAARQALAASLARDSLAVVVPGSGLPPGPRWLLVDVLPKPSGGAEELPAGSVSACLGSAPGVRAVTLSPEADGPARERAHAALAGIEAEAGVVVAVHDTARRPGQLQLIRELAARCAVERRALGILAMRGPWEAPNLAAVAVAAAPMLPPPAVTCAFGYCPAAARAVAGYLLGAHGATGRCPVTVGGSPRSSPLRDGEPNRIRARPR
jgi:beta-N-acetylhexosaminidase